MKIMRRISEGELIPRGYGLYRRQYECDCALLLPIPLNRLAAWAWRLFLWSRFPPADVIEFRAYMAGRRRGWEAGNTSAHTMAYGRGYDVGWNEGVAQGRADERRDILAGLRRTMGTA